MSTMFQSEFLKAAAAGMRRRPDYGTERPLRWEISTSLGDTSWVRMEISRIFGEGFAAAISRFPEGTKVCLDAPASELAKIEDLALAINARSLDEVKRTGKRIPHQLTASPLPTL